MNLAQKLLLPGVQGSGLLAEEQFGEADDPVQGLAQIVRHGVREGIEFPVRTLQLTIRGFQFDRAICHSLQERRVFSTQAPYGQRARQHRNDGAQIEWLDDVIERAALHRFDCRSDCAMTGHDDSHQIDVDLAGRAQQRDSVHAWHHQVGDEDVKGAAALHCGRTQGSERLRAGLRAGRCIAFGCQCTAQRHDLGIFVIHYEEPAQRC